MIDPPLFQKDFEFYTLATKAAFTLAMFTILSTWSLFSLLKDITLVLRFRSLVFIEKQHRWRHPSRVDGKV